MSNVQKIMADYERIIREETEKCSVTKFPTSDGKSWYPYIILPFESRISPKFLNAVIKGATKMLKKELKLATTVLLPEAKAFLLTGLAKKDGLDIALIRKRNYRMPGQMVVEQEKAYQEKEEKDLMYCVGLHEDDIPLLIDDIVSSGGTIISIIRSLKNQGYKIAGVGTIYERGDGVKEVEKSTGCNVKALARLEVKNGKPAISRFYSNPLETNLR